MSVARNFLSLTCSVVVLCLAAGVNTASAQTAAAGRGSSDDSTTVQVAGQTVAIDRATGRLRPPTAEERKALAAGLKNLLNRSTEGLTVRQHANGAKSSVAPEEDNPNRPGAAPWSVSERLSVREAIVRHASALLTTERIQAVIDGVRRREEADSLESIASLPDVSFDVLADTVRRFCRLPRGDERLAPAQTTQLRVALIRSFISDQLEFIGVAKNFLRIRDLD